jgi:hypothetical protein
VARRLPILALLGGLALAAAASAQMRVECASRDYGYQFCPAPDAEAVRLIEQRSRSACIEGRTWGWDRRGVWVDRGCDALFDVRAYRPAPVPVPDRTGAVRCESRDYQYEFCGVAETIVVAQLVDQRSRAACIEGRTWGWRPNGIWVSGGCEGEFEYRTAAPPAPLPPPVQGLVYCASRDDAYTFCPTGRLRDAELVNQRSDAPCVYGRSWGYQNDGVWVDRGCAAEFAIRPR